MSDKALRGLFAALGESRGDPLALRALADWFEEHGDAPAADCLRWVVRTERRPGFRPQQQEYGKFFWECQAPEPILNDPPAQLPEALWQAVGDNDERHPVGSFKS